MCDPPAKIAATNVRIFRPGREPPTRPASRTVWFTNASSPRRPINVAGTINPASATNVSSSKVTSMLSIARDTRLTGSASRAGDNDDFDTVIVPAQGGLSADTRCSTSYLIGGSRFNDVVERTEKPRPPALG